VLCQVFYTAGKSVAENLLFELIIAACVSCVIEPFKDEARTALVKDPVRTAL